jgi:hypothetical protein
MSGRKAWKEEGTSDGGKLILRASLLSCNSKLIWESMITEGNKEKRQSRMTLPLHFCEDNIA